MVKHLRSNIWLAEVARRANRHTAVLFLLREQEVEIRARGLYREERSQWTVSLNTG